MAEILPLSSIFVNPMALAGLALIVPIVLLYLLRPKPKIVLFPSTMFIRFMEKNKRFTSFLQRFIHDPLLLMQLLIITLLVAALAAPYYDSKEDIRPEQSIVVVIDASASMQATDESPTRFQAAVSKARELIRGFNKNDEVSIVVAENIPALVATKASPEAAYGMLGKLNVSDTPTNVGDAMMLGRDILTGSTRMKVMYVLSDFAQGGGLDPQIAKRVAMVSQVEVEFLKFGSGGANVGIVSLDAKRSSANEGELFMTASVRNFGQEASEVNMTVYSGGAYLSSQKKSVDAGGEGFFYFKPNISSGENLIKVGLEGGDDGLSADDTAYTFIPAVRQSSILVLMSSGQDYYLQRMLESLRNVRQPVLYDTSISPLSVNNNFDIIVLGTMRRDITPDTFRYISSQVQKGTNLVVMGSGSLNDVKDDGYLWQMMPVERADISTREAKVQVAQEHDMLMDVAFENVVVKRYYNSRERDNLTKTIVASEFNTPLITYRPYGEGTVVYIGINTDPDWSNFYYSSSFPIFWSRMVAYLTRNKGSAQATTLQTGEYLQLPQSLDIQTPPGLTIRSSSLFLDKAGVYEVAYPDRTDHVTVNLLDSAESNITGSIGEAAAGGEYEVRRNEVDVKVEVFRYLLLIMLAGLVVELILYRKRGLL
ncbi:MAG: BatA and WFA domain-containing protein [Candidatus Altiarchaeota archaeon]